MPRGRKKGIGGVGGLRIKCIITGRITLLNTNVLKKKLLTYGNIEEVQKHYICREAGKYLRRGMSQSEIRKLLGIKEENWTEYDNDFLINIIQKNGKIKKKNGSTKQTQPVKEALTDEECFWRRGEYVIHEGWDKMPIDVPTATKDCCLRPDIFLDHHNCERCGYHANCTFPKKK